MSATRSLIGRVLREPLVQFAVPAALLFGLGAAAGETNDDEIRVTREIVDAIVAERELVLGRTLSTKEKAELVEEFVAEEVLFREAVARGFDRRDGKVREHLVSKMMFLLDEEPPEPSEAELASFYSERAELFTTKASFDLEHAFFPEPLADPDAVLARLAAGADPGEVGQPFYLGTRIQYVTKLELAVPLSADFAQAVDELEVDTWSGPVESSRGWHLVRVTARHEPRLLPQEDIGIQLRNEWTGAWVARAREAQLAELRRHYSVVLAHEEDQG